MFSARGRRPVFSGEPQDLGDGVYEVTILSGTRIPEAVEAVIQLAHQNAARMQVVQFTWGSHVTVRLTAYANAEAVLRDIRRADRRCIGPVIGPEYAEELTDEELASDDSIMNETDRRRLHERGDAAGIALEAKLSTAPMMEIVNTAVWRTVLAEQTQDNWTRATAVFARRLAQLLQMAMAEGHELEDVAEAAIQEADVDLLAGDMIELALSMLMQAWAHGERLRIWNNARWGYDATQTGMVWTSHIYRR